MSRWWSKLGGVLGIVYCLVGLFFVFLGWNGAATYDRISEQFPYLISGGIAGLCLVVIGAALIVTDRSRADRVAVQASIAELRDAVDRAATGAAVGAAAGARPPTAAVSEASSPAPAAPAVDVVVAGEDAFHWPDCRLIEGREDLPRLTVEIAVGRGLTPCRVCAPSSAPGAVLS
jgi:hypothetical protein